ncbi:MAG: efflux transporter periplasmic adaptor subunit [Methylophilales bacterium 16-45-9]|nr:MAG: efflux transporter periplasmic adaptor subunit [Methylophilales bacterium 16-45-9]
MKKLLISMLFLFLHLQSHATDVVMSASQQKSLGITLATIGKNNMISSRLFPAEIAVPVGQERVVSAAQSGLIDQLFVAAGQEVKKGQTVAHLISPDLVNLQNDYLQAVIQKKLLSKSLARDQALFKDGIIAERRLLETESAYEEISASLTQRRQSLRLAGMGEAAINTLNSASNMHSGISLVAPIDGQILEQMVTIGQRVDMGMPLYRIAKLKPLWLEIHAPLETLSMVKLGMPVSIPKLQASGKLIAIVRSVNKADQTLHLRAEITQGAEKLSPGQFVESQINLSDATPQVSVPKSALVRQGKDTYVFVQQTKGFVAIKVTIIAEQGDEAVIDGAFKGNEKVAISGVSAIKGAWLGLGVE